MIVQVGNGLGFYDTDARSLLNANDLDTLTSVTGIFLLGARVLRDTDKDHVYSDAGFIVGDVYKDSYHLLKDWNKEADGTGGIIMHKQIDVNENAQLAVTLLALLPPLTPGGALAFAGGAFAVVNSADEYPVYYPQFPVR